MMFPSTNECRYFKDTVEPSFETNEKFTVIHDNSDQQCAPI